MFDRLPVPGGLARYGVAPDSREDATEALRTIHELCTSGRFRFFGNVTVGEGGIPLAELTRAYDAVFVATGAWAERRLGIPGEDLPGVVAAGSLAAWANGLPGARLDPEAVRSASRVVVVGNGNVALDTARLLAPPPGRFGRTDMPHKAVEVLDASQRSVVVVGRRGPLQASFCGRVLRHTVESVSLGFHDPGMVQEELDRIPQAHLGRGMGWGCWWGSGRGSHSGGSATHSHDSGEARPGMLRRFSEILWKGARSPKVSLRFLLQPVAFEADPGTGRLARVRFVRMALHGDEVTPTAEEVVLPCDLAIVSVGFEKEPFAQRLRADESGRLAAAPAAAPVYLAGWARTGPTGRMQHSEEDARKVAEIVLDDLSSRRPRCTELPVLAEHTMTCEMWLAVDAEERRRGRALGKPREPLTTWADILAAAGAAEHSSV